MENTHSSSFVIRNSSFDLQPLASRPRPRVAFVIHRYGLDLGGGLERLCQLVAEQMKTHWDIEIVTTCARDFSTWKNEYAPGLTDLNGVAVRRFAVDHERDAASFSALTDRVLAGQPTPEQEEAWMRAQGPYSTGLFDHIGNQAASYDRFFFFGYLYATTYFGIARVKDKAVLVPAAHDEPMIRLSIYRSVFTAARYTLWLTLEEERFIRRIYQCDFPGEICGSGPGALAVESLDGADVAKPYLIYVGRVDHPKGCGELLHYFVHSAQQLPNLDLYLVGHTMIEVPAGPRIRSFGYLNDGKKNWLLKHAVALVMPSRYESLSLVLLESWHFGVPVLVNGRCEVLKGQCTRSGGGFMYTDHASFLQGARTLSSSPAERATVGLRGLRYAQQTYSRPKVEQSYQRAFQMAGHH